MRTRITHATLIDSVQPRPLHGAWEVGKRADLIAVAAHSLDDVRNIRKVLLVFRNGRVVSDKRV